MKKVVLVLVCSIVIIVFIALNYLLWDRENNLKNFSDLENLSASKSASIDALGKEIKNQEDINSDLRKQLSNLQENDKGLHDQNLKSADDKQKLSDELNNKSDLIFNLKQQIDLKLFNEIISKWVENLDKGQYEAAYKLQANLPDENNKFISLDDFTSKYKNSVKSIKLKTTKLVLDETSNNKKTELVFDVLLDVKKVQDAEVSSFIEGQNERFFLFSYNKAKKTWEIANILESYN